MTQLVQSGEPSGSRSYSPPLDPRRARAIVLFAAGSVALLMTGFGIIMPVFGRRLAEMGEGVAALGMITMAFALAQLIAAPFMGSLADRYGRKPLILVALFGYAVCNLAFLTASSVEMFVGIRLFEGVVTAGLFPAAMGIVGDVVPEERRAQWVGVIMGSYAAGLVIGPAGGGLLFDLWGYAAPFATSAAFSLAGVAFAARFVPETRWLGSASATAAPSAPRGGMSPAAVIASLPRPLYLLGAMLFLDFVLVFTFAFIEPPFVFYAYDTLDLTTVEFGAIISAYGLAMMLGQALFGRVADRVGPTPVVVAGCLLVSFFYWGLVFFTTFPPLVVTALIAGLGGALVEPALGAVYLQIAPEEHRSRVMGLKESAAALGAVMGPLLVAGAGRWLDAIGLFTVSALLLIGCALLAAIVLPSRGRFTAPVRKT